MASNVVTLSVAGAGPPQRQPAHPQPISPSAMLSRHSEPWFDANRGDTTSVVPAPPARKAAASPDRKTLSALRPPPCTTISAR